MKITCNRDQLLAAFQTAATVAAARTSKPILQNVKMEALDGKVSLTATDLEVGIRVELPDQDVEVPGTALLSVAQFNPILRESTDQQLRIESDGHTVRFIFLDARDDKLIQRFSETRRRHPLATPGVERPGGR